MADEEHLFLIYKFVVHFGTYY